MFSIALGYRCVEALLEGNIWLAFQVDTFLGYPITHIVGTLSIIPMFIFIHYLDTEPLAKDEAKHRRMLTRKLKRLN